MNGTETISSHAEFQSLVERHARPLFRLAYRISGSEAEAEDLVQETFLKAWRQRDKFDGRASFGTWLHRILRELFAGSPSLPAKAAGFRFPGFQLQ